jgi:hypothetical protein
MIGATNGWVIDLDNLSYITPELSDALCRLATGGGFATRTLYENDDETIFNAARPILLNGIEDIGTRSDLLDRCLIIDLPRIDPKHRRTEKAFWSEFEVAQPRILGALLNAASAALRNLPAVEDSDVEWPRMADFAQWVVAGEEALGLKRGAFLEAYRANRELGNQLALESSAVAMALTVMLKRCKGSFKGTATELYDEVSIGQDTRAKGWPKTPRVLSGMLARLAPNLRAAGVAIDQIVIGSGNSKRKAWRITLAEDAVLGRKSVRTKPRNSDPSTPRAPGSLAEHLARRAARAARVAK